MKNYQITEWVHHFIVEQVKEGDLCIDATMGKGNDTVLLSKLAGKTGKVIGFDIQQQAVDSTRERLQREACPENYELLLASHEQMCDYAKTDSVSCIMFNFGYLPGGDHSKATKAASSLAAIETGLKLLKKRGLMSLCIYSGGDSGFEERDAILDYVRKLDFHQYLVIQSEYANRPNNPPIPVLIIKL